MQRFIQYCLLVVCGSLLLAAQTPMREKPAKTPDQQVDVDPLALKVLKAVTDPIRDSKAFSFRTRVMRENLGTNGQIITYFTNSEITVVRPDKLRVNFKGRGREVQLFYNAGQATLYAPGTKLYARLSTAKTLDGVLEELEKRNVYLPVKNLLQSNPYQTLAPDLKTGYVIGLVDLYDTPAHHLAFTEDKAEWQLWVTGAPNPRIQVLDVIDKGRAREPRIVVQFSDWNLNASVQPDMFTFKVPPGASEIEFSKLRKEAGK
jgi:hypothetical protein